VNLRVALVVLVLGFIAVLLVMGALTFVRWLKISYPHYYRTILIAILLIACGLGIWMLLEVRDRPSFQEEDVLTLGEPLVVRVVSTERLTATTSCIVEIHQHLAVLEVMSGTLKVRVESNAGSGPTFCPIGAQVLFDLAWLQHYTLTHRESVRSGGVRGKE
jgi:hypothetical protein